MISISGSEAPEKWTSYWDTASKDVFYRRLGFGQIPYMHYQCPKQMKMIP